MEDFRLLPPPHGTKQIWEARDQPGPGFFRSGRAMGVEIEPGYQVVQKPVSRKGRHLVSALAKACLKDKGLSLIVHQPEVSGAGYWHQNVCFLS